jgi:ubiquinone/menaquinone biosynthesis C-methylase UbiE
MSQTTLGLTDVTEQIHKFYRDRATTDRYATSPDFNLREVEIDYISRYIGNHQRVLDVGCGNGYSTLCYAAKVKSEFQGIDFVPEMIQAARSLAGQFQLQGTVDFNTGDATQLDFASNTFDVVVSQRCLLNLPSRDDQWQSFSEIARVLKSGGCYLMLEGTLQGLQKLNELRANFGLEPIPEADSSNWFSNKFDEKDLLRKTEEIFSRIETIQRFGMYYFISRVIHPLLVAPNQPRYDAPINAIARKICSTIPDFEGLGHVALWVIRK